MPHRMEHTPPAYNHHMGPVMRVRPPHPVPPPMGTSPPVHMIHPSEAATMAAIQRAQACGGHPLPPLMQAAPMWPPAASHYAPHPGSRHQLPPAEPSPRHTNTDHEVESAEETAASALLMASTAPRASPNSETTQQTSNEEPKAAKKRKKHLDVLRRNQVKSTTDPANGSPCQVSPVSASSTESHDGHSEEGVSIGTHSSRTAMMLHEASSSGSYDERMKKTAPPEHVDVPHFPSVLHEVLSETNAQSVLQWLPHGQAWKIVRWDALRREVLPRYFPELCQEKGEGSIDSFLEQVRVWGFEEVKDGPDAGAYRHTSFIHGNVKLCKDMANTQLPPKPSDANDTEGNKSHHKDPKESILRVPSLASDSIGDQDPKHASAEQQRLRSVNSANTVPSGPVDGHEMQERGSPIHHGWTHGSMGYRSNDGYGLQGSPVRHGVTFPPPYSPRFPFRTYAGGSPLKSGRGGSRVSAVRQWHEPSQSSFPVSQRGKGNRRVHSPQGGTNLGDNQWTNLAENQATSLGPHLQNDSATTVTISRKMKRKLPLARKSSSTSDAETCQIAEQR